MFGMRSTQFSAPAELNCARKLVCPEIVRLLPPMWLNH